MNAKTLTAGLNELFLDELADIYDAEHQLVLADRPPSMRR